MNRAIPLILLTLLALVLSACGGDAPTPTAVPAPVAPTVVPTSPPAASPSTPAFAPNASPTAASATPFASPATADRVAAARRFITQLAAGDYGGAEGSFDDTMRKGLPPDKLMSTWAQVQAQAGAFQRQGGTRTQQVQQNGTQYDIVFITCTFAQANIDMRVVFNPQGQIGGLFFAPSATPTPASTAASQAPYVTPGAFQEREVQVHNGDWTLPGTLSKPSGAGPFPAVVLVQGSGPSDRDETVAANKPFRDLAGGLASRGIAVLRYDKRTFVDPAKAAAIANITVKEEVIDDAAAAIAVLRQTAGVDPARVFLLGHSLGGTLAPRIAAGDPRLAGLIILAGATRPLEDAIVDQYTYLVSLHGTATPAQQQQLDQIKQQAARVKDAALSAATPAADLPLGVPASYWLDLRSYHPTEVARSLPQPILILQGLRDYQVTAADLRGWQDALAGRPTVTFMTYPALDHLFLAGTSPSTPDEYAVPGHVAAAVIADIAAWITAARAGGG